MTYIRANSDVKILDDEEWRDKDGNRHLPREYNTTNWNLTTLQIDKWLIEDKIGVPMLVSLTYAQVLAMTVDSMPLMGRIHHGTRIRTNYQL